MHLPICACKHKLQMVAVAATCLIVAGCFNEGKRRSPEDLPPEPEPPLAAQRDPVLAETIGAISLLGSAADYRVRGYSLVAGLGEDGSDDCPTVIRDYLIEYMTKTFGPDNPTAKGEFSPETLIDSLDTAAVEVIGRVPAGAPVGTPFDVEVTVIPGTATRSLDRGLLLPCELRFMDEAASGQGLLTGQTVAHASGPVFLNPFGKSGNQLGNADPRRGTVLGGGHAIEARGYRILLREPAYALSRRIERRINERFGQRPAAAEARSKGIVVLHTPPDYADDPAHFARLVTHMYVHNQPGYNERRLRELARQIVKPGAQRESVSLVWEAMGRAVIPSIQPLYTHEDPQVRFYAARAALRLGDVNALPVMTAFLNESDDHALRLLAIRELAQSEWPQAGLALAPLVNDPDQQVRIAAYRGLLKHRHPVVHTDYFPSVLDPNHLNLALDVVESNGPPLVYIRRTIMPRIAIFGPRLALRCPLFYAHPDDAVTLNASAPTDDVTIFAKWRGHVSKPILVPARVPALVTALADVPRLDDAKNLRGIGLPYTQIVRVLATLCEDDTIPAKLVLERPPLAELLGPETAPDRPEADRPEDIERELQADRSPQTTGRSEGGG